MRPYGHWECRFHGWARPVMIRKAWTYTHSPFMKVRTTTQAHEKGRAQGAAAKDNLRAGIEEAFSSARADFPSSREMDYARELVALDQLRMASPPVLARFPETR